MTAGSSSPPPSKLEQIIIEFFAKCLHIIVDARVVPLPGAAAAAASSPASSPASSSSQRASASSSSSSRDRWFNIVLPDCAAASDSAEAWRRRNPGEEDEAMVVDVILLRSPAWLDSGSSSRQPSPDSSTEEPVAATVVERWVVTHERCRHGGSTSAGSHGSSSSSRFSSSRGALEVAGIYKRLVILMRSLYCSLRTLPAHRLFHLANSSSQSRGFSLTYRVSSSASPSPLQEADANMMLTPVETPTGRLCVSVAYRHASAVTALEVTPPLLPKIIQDYVGSPNTDPLRRLPSESLAGSLPSGGISGRRGVHIVSLPSSVPSSPSAAAARRHGWGAVLKAGTASPSFRSSLSSSPSQPDFHHPSPPRLPSPLQYSPQSSAAAAAAGGRNFSQPIPIPSSREHRRRSPGAPIPKSAPTNLQAAATRLSVPTLADSLLFISPPYPYVSADDKPEVAPPSGMRRSLYGSSRISLSRSSSSRLNHQDEVDDEIFACPFAVYDVGSDEPRGRAGSPNRAHDSSMPNAAVGQLVRVLKTAAPLRERAAAAAASSEPPAVAAAQVGSLDSGQMMRAPVRMKPPKLYKFRSMEPRTDAAAGGGGGGGSSGTGLSNRGGWKSMGEALEELRLYREIREAIREGGRKCTDNQLPSRARGALF